jgi:hypothetical protein
VDGAGSPNSARLFPSTRVPRALLQALLQALFTSTEWLVRASFLRMWFKVQGSIFEFRMVLT